MIVNTNLNPEAIPIGYLSEAAYEWDKLGDSNPVDFVNMLKFETAGTRQKEVSNEILNELSNEAVLV